MIFSFAFFFLSKLSSVDARKLKTFTLLLKAAAENIIIIRNKIIYNDMPDKLGKVVKSARPAYLCDLIFNKFAISVYLQRY